MSFKSLSPTSALFGYAVSDKPVVFSNKAVTAAAVSSNGNVCIYSTTDAKIRTVLTSSPSKSDAEVVNSEQGAPTSIALDDIGIVAFLGIPLSENTSGSVVLYRRTSVGRNWVNNIIIRSTPPNTVDRVGVSAYPSGALYGDAVSITLDGRAMAVSGIVKMLGTAQIAGASYATPEVNAGFFTESFVEIEGLPAESYAASAISGDGTVIAVAAEENLYIAVVQSANAGQYFKSISSEPAGNQNNPKTWATSTVPTSISSHRFVGLSLSKDGNILATALMSPNLSQAAKILVYNDVRGRTFFRPLETNPVPQVVSVAIPDNTTHVSSLCLSQTGDLLAAMFPALGKCLVYTLKTAGGLSDIVFANLGVVVNPPPYPVGAQTSAYRGGSGVRIVGAASTSILIYGPSGAKMYVDSGAQQSAINRAVVNAEKNIAADGAGALEPERTPPPKKGIPNDTIIIASVAAAAIVVLVVIATVVVLVARRSKKR